MVMTYKPTNTAQKYPTDISQPPQSSPFSPNTPELPASAPLIFPEPEPTGSAGQQNKFKQIGHFISDYGDRRAQAKYASNTFDRRQRPGRQQYANILLVTGDRKPRLHSRHATASISYSKGRSQQPHDQQWTCIVDTREDEGQGR